MEIIDPQSGCSGGAEAVLGLQPNSSISIAYHSLFGPHSDLMLLEVDEKLLPEILHQRFVWNFMILIYQFLYIDLLFAFSSSYCCFFLIE